MADPRVEELFARLHDRVTGALMRPVLLEMAGFASFREPTTVDFAGAEYFALVGPTGAGKSTVIDAMTFALYGSVPRWDDRRTVALALAPTVSRGTVRLVFDVGGERYVVARELRRAATGSVSVRSARLERLRDPAGTAGPTRRPSRSPTARRRSRRPSRSCSGSRSATSARAWCCRRATSRSSCTPSRASARRSWSACSGSASTT